MKTETLVYIQTRHGFALRDAKSSHIGWFNSEPELLAWCSENGYKARKIQ